MSKQNTGILILNTIFLIALGLLAVYGGPYLDYRHQKVTSAPPTDWINWKGFHRDIKTPFDDCMKNTAYSNGQCFSIAFASLGKIEDGGDGAVIEFTCGTFANEWEMALCEANYALLSNDSNSERNCSYRPQCNCVMQQAKSLGKSVAEPSDTVACGGKEVIARPEKDSPARDFISFLKIPDLGIAVSFLIIPFFLIFLVVVLPLNYLARKKGPTVLYVYFVVLFLVYAFFMSAAAGCMAESCILSGLGTFVMAILLGCSVVAQGVIWIIFRYSSLGVGHNQNEIKKEEGAD